MGGTRLAGVRRALAQRSRREKTVGLAAVALVASAPFGGLDRAGETPPAALDLGAAVAVGPYDVTFVRAYRAKEFAGSQVEPWEAPPVTSSAEARRLLVLEVDVTNDGKRPEYAHVLTKAVALRGAAKTDSFGGPSADPKLVYRTDGSAVSTVSPGMTHRLALLFEQSSRTRSPRATIAVTRLVYVGKGGLASNLDEDYWLHLDETASRGTITVGEPGAQG
ncbi:MAG TPA: hypothetical protein VJL80_12860 [Aeromicrobium sp.]|nr:hypothetical protein [Aeromicrobium sp.]HKY58923.1 hypothetical protein [Aeromicrobium sp.]